MSITLTVKYPLGHSYTEEWKEAQNICCPECTEPTVWREARDRGTCEDSAPMHICLTCGHSFNYEADFDEYTAQRLSQLIAHIEGEEK